MALQHVDPGMVTPLAPLGEQLGQVRSHALAKTDRFEAVRLVVPADASIPEHAVSGPITLHCLEGTIRLDTSRGSVDLRAGDWLYLAPGDPHSVFGLEDSSLLLTIIF